VVPPPFATYARAMRRQFIRSKAATIGAIVPSRHLASHARSRARTHTPPAIPPASKDLAIASNVSSGAFIRPRSLEVVVDAIARVTRAPAVSSLDGGGGIGRGRTSKNRKIEKTKKRKTQKRKKREKRTMRRRWATTDLVRSTDVVRPSVRSTDVARQRTSTRDSLSE